MTDIWSKPFEDAKALYGSEHPEMKFAFRVVYPDFTSSRGFRWPFPSQWATANLPADKKYSKGDSCPTFVGDGLCLAKTFYGASSGGIVSPTYLVCGYLPEDILGEDSDKIRVTRALVCEVVSLPKLAVPGANLRSANLYGANLRSANLYGANLRSADLYGADLYGADLRSADLYGANLRSADLYGADLYGADLRSANLYGADLRSADLYGANLYGADLRSANLYGADLRSADLYGADLYGADLRSASVDAAFVPPVGWKNQNGLLVKA